MNIGKIHVEERVLWSDETNIAYQHSDNLQIQIEFKDTTWDGYSLMFLYAHDYDMHKTGIALYDPSSKLLTLPLGAFNKSGCLYISMYGIKQGVRLTSGCVMFNIDISGNPDATNIPRGPDWIEIAQQLMDQLFANEYKKPLDDLIKTTKATIDGLLSDVTLDYDGLKTATETALNKLRIDCANAIDASIEKFDIDKAQMLSDASMQIQMLKESTTAAIDTMLKNANTDFISLKTATTNSINGLVGQAQAQQTQINVAKASMDTLQTDLITKRDSGYFDGKDGKNGSDGALVPSSGFFTLFKSGGHLKVRYPKGASAPPLIHKNGHLYYKKVKEV